jgi:anti-sigma B factor antagonist
MSRFPVITGMADGSTLVELSGDIDLLAAPQITKCMDAVTRGPHPRVIVDLRSVTFIDCRGLSVLVRARRRIRERAGKLSLVTTDSRILQTMRRTGLLESFSVFGELGKAQDAVAPGLREPAATA